MSQFLLVIIEFVPSFLPGQFLAAAATLAMPVRAIFSISGPVSGCRPAAMTDTMSTTISMPSDFAFARNARVWSPRFGKDRPADSHRGPVLPVNDLSLAHMVNI